GGAQQRQAGAGRQARAHARVPAAAGQQRLHIVGQGVAGMDLGGGLAQSGHVAFAEDRQSVGDQLAAVGAGQQRAFGFGTGIAERETQQEAVQDRKSVV